MNKKGEGSGGIGILGVIVALFIFFFIRGCVKLGFQDSINEFCVENGFEYGEETVENTLIECKEFNNDNSTKFKYEIWEEYRDLKRKREG